MAVTGVNVRCDLRRARRSAGLAAAGSIALGLPARELVERVDHRRGALVADASGQRLPEGVLAERGAVVREVVHVDLHLRHAQPRADRERAPVLRDRAHGVAACRTEDPKLAERPGHVGLVSEPFVELEGLLVALLGFGIVTAGLREHTSWW